MYSKYKKFRLAGWTILLLSLTIPAFIFAFPGAAAGDKMPEPDGENLWKYITKENPYKEWNKFPGFEDMYEGQSPHGAYLEMYVNDIAYDALKEGKNEMPDKSIIVKLNYDKNKNLAALTPVYKVKGYNADAGDWFWAKYGKDGSIMAEGKVQSCIDCHTKKKGDDYLFSLSMK